MTKSKYYEESKKRFLSNSNNKRKKVEPEEKTSIDENFHHVKNLALLYLILSLKSKNNTIKKTVKDKTAYMLQKPKLLLFMSLDLWNQLISSKYFINNYLNANKNIEKQQDKVYSSLMDIIKEIIIVPKKNNYNAFITPKELFTHTSKYNSVMTGILRKSYLSPHIYSVETSIGKYKDILKKKISRLDLKALDLIKETKDEIDIIKDIYSYDLSQCQTICDELARDLSLAAIDTYNNNDVKRNDKFHKNIQSIQKTAISISVSDYINNRIKASIDNLAEAIIEKEDDIILEPIYKLFNTYTELTDGYDLNTKYHNAKEFAFKLRLHRVKALKTLGAGNKSYKEIIKSCAFFLRSLSIDLNNGSKYGKAIEIIDFGRRLISISGGDDAYKFETERSRLVNNNNTHKENETNFFGMLVGSALGGGLRAAKKNMQCGCNSGLSLQECCSMHS